MEKKLYSIKDTVAKEFAQPFYCNNDDVAKRIVLNSFLSSNEVKLYSSDYFLYCLGSYDISTGVIVPDVGIICCLSDLISDEVSNEVQ